MDARPNPINKILPCTKTVPIEIFSASGASAGAYQLNGYSLDPDSDEDVFLNGQLPYDMKVGSDIKVILNGCPKVTNSSGVEKKVRLYSQYSFGRDGVKCTGTIEGDGVLIAIPNGELAYTIHKTELITISDLQAGDILGFRAIRDADHTDDTYTSDWFVTLPVVLEYTADKIGVI